MTFAQRIELHEHIAVFYESLPNSVKRTDQLAYHWTTVIENTKDISDSIILKAIQYLEQASAVAAIAYGADIARIWREKALQLTTKLPDSATKEDLSSRLTRLLHNATDSGEQRLKISLREISGAGGPCQHLV